MFVYQRVMGNIMLLSYHNGIVTCFIMVFWLYTYIYIFIYIYIYLYTYLGKFNHELTVLPNPGIMVNKGNHPPR